MREVPTQGTIAERDFYKNLTSELLAALKLFQGRESLSESDWLRVDAAIAKAEGTANQQSETNRIEPIMRGLK